MRCHPQIGKGRQEQRKEQRRHFLSREPKDFDFGAVLDGLFGASVQFFGDRFGEIIFAAVVADVGGNSLEDNYALAACQRDGDFSRLCLTMPADYALHGALLVLNSVSHQTGSG